MGKADKMVERNKKVSREKAESVCKEIERMLADKERISPQELVRRTGVSRGFLYKNPRETPVLLTNSCGEIRSLLASIRSISLQTLSAFARLTFLFRSTILSAFPIYIHHLFKSSFNISSFSARIDLVSSAR